MLKFRCCCSICNPSSTSFLSTVPLQHSACSAVSSDLQLKVYIISLRCSNVCNNSLPNAFRQCSCCKPGRISNISFHSLTPLLAFQYCRVFNFSFKLLAIYGDTNAGQPICLAFRSAIWNLSTFADFRIVFDSFMTEKEMCAVEIFEIIYSVLESFVVNIK